MNFIHNLYSKIRLTIYSHLASEFHAFSETREGALREDLQREVEALRKEFLEELHLTRSHFARDLRSIHSDIHVLNGSKYGPERRLKSPIPVPVPVHEKEQS